MKRFIALAIFILLIFSIYFILPDSNNKLVDNIDEFKYDYKPMVYVNKQIYGIKLGTVDSIPFGWKLYGCIKKEVSSSEPMIKEELYSNSLEVGTKIFTNPSNNQCIYAEVKIEDKIVYVKYQKE